MGKIQEKHPAINIQLAAIYFVDCFEFDLINF
jgi:hypothetical protein